MISYSICLSLPDLFYLPQCPPSPSMLLQMAKFHSFLWLTSIPLCVCMCVRAYHIFFTHLSVDGHLGCFHVLAIVNNAAMNIGVHASFRISVFVFFRYIPWSGIPGSYDILFLGFFSFFLYFGCLASSLLRVGFL